MIPGIEVLTGHEPAQTLPKDLSGVKVALKMFGGVGDCLIAIGSVAPALAERGAIVTAVVAEHHQELLAEVRGVCHVAEVKTYNNPAIRHKQDVLIDFARTFNAPRQLRAENYYKLVSDRVGFRVRPGSFKNFEYWPDPEDKLICVHTSASNRNRQWSDDKWRDLANELVKRGWRVVFLGKRSEFGFNEEGIKNYSDIDTGLLPQMRCLAVANAFVGCDSGFAHVAGILGVPGVVLFGNTSEDHVIAEYPSLKGVDAYDKVEYGPTRSLKRGCQRSIDAMRAIEVCDVLAKI